MSNFRVGEKVVCVKHDPFCVDTMEFLPAPKVDEIVTINWINHDGTKIGFEEYDFDDYWDACLFRPIDELSNTTYDEVMQWIESGQPIETLN